MLPHFSPPKLPMQEVCPLGRALGMCGRAALERGEGWLLLPVVVVLQPGDHPHADCEHGDACKDRTQAGMQSHPGPLGSPCTSPPSLVPKTACLGQVWGSGSGRKVIAWQPFPLLQVAKEMVPTAGDFLVCVSPPDHPPAPLCAPTSNPRHLGWVFPAPKRCGKQEGPVSAPS